MKIELDRRANKSLAKIPKRERAIIEEILLGLESLNEVLDIDNDGKLKRTKDRYKIRVGNYRIIYKVESQNAILITSIRHRKDVYDKIFEIVLSL